MHIADGALSTAVTAATLVGGAGLLAFSLKGVENEEIPNMALMTSVFFVGGIIRIPVTGITSLHLILAGFIGLVAGRRAPVSIAIALLLQLFLLQYGGLSTIGANLINAGLPALLIGMFIRPMLKSPKINGALIGAIAGGGGIAAMLVLLSIVLVQSNMRFDIGPFSVVRILAVSHIPLIIIEAAITAAAVGSIIKIRPEFFGRTMYALPEENQDG